MEQMDKYLGEVWHSKLSSLWLRSASQKIIDDKKVEDLDAAHIVKA
jgi:hypothetical protein